MFFSAVSFVKRVHSAGGFNTAQKPDLRGQLQSSEMVKPQSLVWTETEFHHIKDERVLKLKLNARRL